MTTDIVTEIINLQIDEAMKIILVDDQKKVLAYPHSLWKTVYDCLNAWFKAQTPQNQDFYHKNVKITFNNALAPEKTYVIFTRRLPEKEKN
jgi:hypothetical protein